MQSTPLTVTQDFYHAIQGAKSKRFQPGSKRLIECRAVRIMPGIARLSRTSCIIGRFSSTLRSSRKVASAA